MKTIFKQFAVLLEENNIPEIDVLLERVHTSGEFSEDQINSYWDIFQEITLYSEFKEETYKTEALKLINEI